MNIFGENSLFQRSFGFLGKLIALNFLWIIGSLPILTAGASTTALFYCVLKMRKEGDCNVVADFVKSYKENFKQSLLIWLSLLAIGFFLYLEKKAIATMPDMMAQIFGSLFLVIILLTAMMAVYIFPVLASFENSIRRLVSNAFYYILKKIGYAAAIAAITFLPMFMTLTDRITFSVFLFIWVVCGFSLTAYIDSWFFWKLFEPFYAEMEKKEYDANKYETDQYVF